MNNLQVPRRDLTVRPLVKDYSVNKVDKAVHNNFHESAARVNVTKPLRHTNKLLVGSVALNNRFQVLVDL